MSGDAGLDHMPKVDGALGLTAANAVTNGESSSHAVTSHSQKQDFPASPHTTFCRLMCSKEWKIVLSWIVLYVHRSRCILCASGASTSSSHEHTPEDGRGQGENARQCS